MLRGLLLLGVFLMVGCGTDCPPGFVAGRDECRFDEASVLDFVSHMDDGSLVKVNKEAYLPPYSSKPYMRNTWVSPVKINDDRDDDRTAADLFKSIDQDNWSDPLEDEFPVGTVIIHEAVNREEAHGVEIKRDDYEDDIGRPWWMVMVYDDGSYQEPDPAWDYGCYECHSESYRPSEGLWGVPTMAK